MYVNQPQWPLKQVQNSKEFLLENEASELISIQVKE